MVLCTNEDHCFSILVLTSKGTTRHFLFYSVELALFPPLESPFQGKSVHLNIFHISDKI